MPKYASRWPVETLNAASRSPADIRSYGSTRLGSFWDIGSVRMAYDNPEEYELIGDEYEPNYS
jgi:hypothetical protein